MAQQTKKKNARIYNREVTTGTRDLPMWIIPLLFLLTTAIFFRGQLFGTMYFWEDFNEYIYPAFSFAARALSVGEIPFWNPYLFSGTPFLADVATGFFYPLNWLLALVVKNGKLPVLALEILIIAHCCLAQVAMYRLARRMETSQIAAIISAISYSFSGIFACHIFHPMMIIHFAWFPLVFLYFRDSIMKPVGAGYWKKALLSSLIAGLLLGIMMLSGHPQTTLYLLVLLLMFTVWTIIWHLRHSENVVRQILQSGCMALLPVLIGSGIFAIQLLHSQEFSQYSERNFLTLEKASIGSMQAKQLFTVLIPKLFGVSDAAAASGAASATPFYLQGSEYYAYWETAFYFGVPALILAIIGVIVSFRRQEQYYFGLFTLIVCGFALLFALGNNGFLFPAFFQLPLFDRFRVPSRMVMLIPFLMAMAAGLGFDALYHEGTRLAKIFFGVVGICALITILGAGLILSEPPEQMRSAITGFSFTAFVFVLITGGIGWFVMNKHVPILFTGWLCIGVLFIDLIIAGSTYNNGKINPERAYELQPGLEQMLQVKPPDTLFRVRTRDRGMMVMQRNQGLITPIMMYEGYMPLLIERRLPPSPSAAITYDLLSIRYEITIDTVSGSPYFAERSTWLPQARMVYAMRRSVPDSVKSLATSGLVNFTQEVIVEKDLPITLPGTHAGMIHHSVHCETYTANEMEYKVQTAQNGVLVLSEIWYPAWKAEIDGVATEVLRVNYSLRGIAIQAGTHTIRLIYRSDAFITGRMITLITLCGTLAAIGLLWLSERRSKT